MASPQEEKKLAQALAARLARLQILVLDVDVNGAQLVRRTLGTLGISSVSISKNSEEIAALLAEKPVDIFITEWDTKPANGLDVTRFLRSPDSPDRMLPIILTTYRTDQQEHAQARGVGVNDIVMRPFNTRGLQSAITSIIDTPKQFIITHQYTGPDRRVLDLPLPPGIENRRAPEPGVAVVDKSAVNDIFYDDTPRVVFPDYALKHRIETPETKEEAAAPTRRVEDFVKGMTQDMLSVRECYRALLATPEQAQEQVEKLSVAALALRTKGIRSGYIFASRMAAATHDFCQRRFRAELPLHVVILGKHVESLQAIVTAKLRGNDSKVGRALMEELQLLVKKCT